MSQKTKYALFIIALVTAGVTARLLPHAANFVPISALVFLAAAYLPRKLALVVPLSIMILSDLVIGLHPLIMYTWGSFVLIGIVGSFVYKKYQNRWHLAGLGPVASVIFFVVTNFGVWLQGRMYEHSFAGLMRCFTMAMPFFRSTLLSDIAFTPLLFIVTFFTLKLVRSNPSSKVSAVVALQ
ncbi:MAG: hypothetical protein JWO47_908 [Candidatus Saccharibacteria bacterium]|nr:hypothetical protein [Candidatus Saccharibacteria bacterium]